MKKQLLISILLGLLISGASFAQNLITDGDFKGTADNTKKYRADCAPGTECFNGNVPGWFTQALATDTGVENDSYYGRAGYAYNGDSAGTCQVIGVIDLVKRKFTLKYEARLSWTNANPKGSDALMFVTRFYALTGTDTVGMVLLDSLPQADPAYLAGDPAAADTNFYPYTHVYTVPQSEVGKKLVIGFDYTGGIATAWSHFTNFELTVEDAPVNIVNPIAQSEVNVFPNPSNGLVTFSNLDVNSFEIYNIAGVKVQTVYVKGTEAKVDGLQRGLYFARINSQTIKFAIK